MEVIPVRFERTTHSLEGCCSIQLSYWDKFVLKLNDIIYYNLFIC